MWPRQVCEHQTEDLFLSMRALVRAAWESRGGRDVQHTVRCAVADVQDPPAASLSRATEYIARDLMCHRLRFHKATLY